jgi:hypothetical protein
MSNQAPKKKISDKAKQAPSRAVTSKLDCPAFPDNIMLGIEQIDQGNLIEAAFFSSFLAYFTPNKQGYEMNQPTWMHSLPSLSKDGTNAALSLAIRATATAYAGSETGNPAVTQQAWKVYGKALQAHVKLLQCKRPHEYTVHMVSTSVMLSIFEAMQATTADAYHEHISGAVKILQFTAPGQCLGGVLCQLFFHIRSQITFVNLTGRKVLAVPARKFFAQSFESDRLPLFQQLMDRIAILAEIYNKQMSLGSIQQRIDLSTYARVKSEIEALWLEYQGHTRLGYSVKSRCAHSETAFCDGFTALTIAYFSAAHILLGVLSSRLGGEMYVGLNECDHHATIINSARFLRGTRIGCAYMRMSTPLLLVAIHSPNAELRSEAISVFESWRHGHMKGISALAFERISVQQKNAVVPESTTQSKPCPLQVPRNPRTPVEVVDWAADV